MDQYNKKHTARYSKKYFYTIRKLKKRLNPARNHYTSQPSKNKKRWKVVSASTLNKQININTLKKWKILSPEIKMNRDINNFTNNNVLMFYSSNSDTRGFTVIGNLVKTYYNRKNYVLDNNYKKFILLDYLIKHKKQFAKRITFINNTFINYTRLNTLRISMNIIHNLKLQKLKLSIVKLNKHYHYRFNKNIYYMKKCKTKGRIINFVDEEPTTLSDSVMLLIINLRYLARVQLKDKEETSSDSFVYPDSVNHGFVKNVFITDSSQETTDESLSEE